MSALLAHLQNQLSHWTGQVNTLNEHLRMLNRRRRDVESVKSALGTTARNNSNDVNARLRSARNRLENAISYRDRDAQIHGILSISKEEQQVGADFNLTSADGELQNELNDIDRQIAETQGALDKANSNVASISSAIAAEERRIQEEKAAAAAAAAAEAAARESASRRR